MHRLILDASALMAALLPGEPLKDPARRLLKEYVQGKVDLVAPTLFPYEVANSLLKAERKRGHGLLQQAVDGLLQRVEELEIPLVPVPPLETLQVARRYGCWAYDAAYLALAEKTRAPLVTADLRLSNAVGGKFECIQYLGDLEP